MGKRTNQISENLTAAALALSIVATASAQEYRLTDLVDLGFVPNPDKDGTLGINSDGEVVYGFDVAGQTHAFVWLPEPNYGLAAGFHDLSGQFGTQNPSIARDINVHGQVAGQVDGTRAGEGQAIVWDLPAGNFQLLGFLSDDSWSRAIAINDANPATVVGESEVDGFCPPSGGLPCVGVVPAVVVRSFRATLQNGAALSEFAPLESDDCNQSSLVRDVVLLVPSGDLRAVGVSTSQGLEVIPQCFTLLQCGEEPKDAANWGPDIELTSFDPERPSEGRGVNDEGKAVGWAYRTSPAPCFISAVFWETPGAPFDLGLAQMPPMQAGEQSRAEAINNLAQPQVVGWNIDADLAILWEMNQGGTWTATDLNSLIPVCSQANELVVRQAHDINDDGWIITWGRVRNPDTGLFERHAFLLTPVGDCPEDVNRDGVVGVLDLIDLLMVFGLPCPVGQICWEDVNNDCTVNVLDLIDLLLKFSTVCPGSTANPPQSLEEALEDAGLTMDDWDDFMDVMQTGTQEEKDNWHCWMTHYLSCHDPLGTCNPPPPNCQGSDPFGGHRH